MTEQENLDYFTEILKNDPASKAFAPLAEGYRKTGQLEKALKIALDGVSKHPDFNSGKVALAKILIDLKKFDSAESTLLEVVESDFENLLAHRSLGEVYIHKNEMGKALDAFKAALLANPLDKMSTAMVTKLESISAKAFDAEVFSISNETKTKTEKLYKRKNLSIHAALSYIDALISRNNYTTAGEHTADYLIRFPKNPELIKRQDYLSSLKKHNPRLSRADALSKPEITKQKLKTLNSAFIKIEEQMKTRPELAKG